MPTKITEKVVKELLPPAVGNRRIYDTDLPGFGVRITANAAVAFVLNYTLRGVERRFTIGRWPTWSVLAARDEAKRLKRLVDQGHDPLKERLDHRAAPTVRQLWERYETEHLPALSKAGGKDVERMFEQLILPKLGSKKLMDLTSADTDKLHRDITKDRGGTRANRSLMQFRHALNMAIRWQWLERNPAASFNRNDEQGRSRYLTSDELERLDKALDSEKDGAAADAVRLLLLTGARRSEVLGATWSEFDLGAKLWIKPAKRTKQRKEHRVPLSDAAVALLIEMNELKGESEYLFPSTNGTWRTEINDAWNRIRKAAGLKDFRLHDLRHSFASIGASNGLSLEMIGSLLGHGEVTTTARYSHLFDDALRSAANLIGGKLSKAR